MGFLKDLLRSELLRACFKSRFTWTAPRYYTKRHSTTTLLRSRAREESAPEIDNPGTFRGRHSEIGPQ